MLNRKGRCENCGTKFIIKPSAPTQANPLTHPETDVRPAKASSRITAQVLAVLVVGIAAWAAYQKLVRTDPPTEAPVDGIALAEDSPSSRPDQTPSPSPAPASAPAQAPAPTPAPVPAQAPAPAPIQAPTPAQVEVTPPGTPEVEPLSKTFPVVADFDDVDIRDYQSTYPDVNMGWMPSSAAEADAAKEWGSYLGPLGIRIRSHAPQLQHRPAFAAIVPIAIQAADGTLALNAAEVMQIAPGSPADGHLQVGDLIIGIEGEMLKSGNQYRPDWKFMHKDARELQLMLGEKIDQAQGRGDIQLSVLRFPADTATPLPVIRKELWSGTGGDSSVGVQTFDLEITGEGYLTLESDQFDEVIHGDGTVWLDVTLEGDYGSESLFELPAESIRAGYGKPVIRTDQAYNLKGTAYPQSLELHAHGSAMWRIPAGTKRITGSFAALSYGKVQPKVHFTNLALPLTGIHKQHTVEIRFPIGKAGSFADIYPKDCAKSDLLAARHTAWLAAQQRENGSWPRLRGYTRDGWDTSWCALALMSGGDPKYDEQVRKAAYLVAYADAPSEWTAERAMRLIFLSEYYLRTRDAKIVPGIQAAYYQMLDCCKTDHMAGHKVNGFGYGIAGQHYGTGHLALAIAMASRTPITRDERLVKNIISHAGEVCVNGTYAYGRGRRMARDDSRQHSGGNAMSGPGILGVQIGGGHASAIKEHTERIAASIGDGDNSHATSSLAYIFSSLAIAAADEDVFIDHMRNFRYKMAIDDNWEGGILKSAFPLDLQGGEGVTSNWIRTAGTVLVLNALKHELAITGKKELWADQHLAGTPVSEWGGQIHSYYLRNWCLAKELLGNRAPAKLSIGIRDMNQLPRTTDLVPQTKAIVLELAPQLIKQIAADARLDRLQRGYAIELICGLDVKIYTTKDGDQQKVDVQINQPLHQLNWRDQDKAALFENSPLPLRTNIRITADNLADPVEVETEGTQDFNLDEGTRSFSMKTPLKDPAREQFDGSAQIAFKLGTKTVSYQRPLKFNTEFSHSNNFNLRRFKLPLKLAPRAYFQSQPMVIAGIPFDCMYPSERMLDITKSSDDLAVTLHEGDSVIVDLASENFICPWVHSIEVGKASPVELPKPRSVRSIRGNLDGKTGDLHDASMGSACTLTADNGKNIIEFDFGKAVTLNGVDTGYDGSCFIRVWYRDGDTWVPLVWDNYTAHSNHHPTFPDTKASEWRLELQLNGSKPFRTLRFYHNPHRILDQGRLPQMDKRDILPPIQPE